MPRRTVLVGEDDRDAQEAVSEILSTAGYDVVCADDGRELKTLLQGGLRPAAILLDLSMPRADGYDFLAWRAGQQELRKVPVVVYSGATFNEMQLRMFGVARVLAKPASADELLAGIAAAVGSVTPPGAS
jgi:two-component system, NtrC family, response regulator AtoC